jgi:integrase/recombinase XerD
MSTTITWKDLRRDIDDFIAFKRRMGFIYKHGEASLRRFQRFVEPMLRRRPSTLKAITDKYRAEGGKPTCRMFVRDAARARDLCLYRQRRDSRGYVPEPLKVRRRRDFVPHLLSQDEVIKTLSAARRYCGTNPNCSGETAYLLVLICYCTGLRIGEAARLELRDVDVKACTFRIHSSKRRSRVVPFGQDLAEKLSKYLRQRAAWTHSNRGTTALLLDLRGHPLGYQQSHRLLTAIWRQLGLKPPRGFGGPRPTDLRHAFARGRLAAWDRRGVDVNALLPWLSAYMGHAEVLGTETYLHSTPELLSRASRRFEKLYRQAGSQ